MRPLTRLVSIIAPVVLLCTASMAQLVGDCGHWNSEIYGGLDLVETFDTQWHYTSGPASGEHYIDAWHDGTCRYVCPNGQNEGCLPETQCIVTATASNTPTAGDSGAFTVIQAAVPPVPQWHVYSTNNAGSSNTNNGQVTADASSAIAVAQCPGGICNVTVKVSAQGIMDFSITGGFSVWEHPDKFIGFCQSQHAFPQTPIIIDIANEGFQLTNAAAGVITKMVDPVHAIHAAWTQPASHNAFLYLNGHLFGNSTPQLPSKDCPDPTKGCGNGFEALSLYDINGDGVIDANDPVFSQLRLWIDSNHDGVVQPGELFTLPSMGVESISLHYVIDKQTDAFGNQFRYRGHLKGAQGVDRTIYDVLLTLE